jgi:hypothetical protein
MRILNSGSLKIMGKLSWQEGKNKIQLKIFSQGYFIMLHNDHDNTP